MNIIVVNVNTSRSMTEAIAEAARRYASPGTNTVALQPYFGAEASKAVEIDHAEVICLGCAGMAGLEEAITSTLHVPAIDGVGAAVRLAEAVVGLSLKTSKRSTYAPPDPKEIIAWPLSLALGLRGGSVGANSVHLASPSGGQGGE